MTVDYLAPTDWHTGDVQRTSIVEVRGWVGNYLGEWADDLVDEMTVADPRTARHSHLTAVLVHDLMSGLGLSGELAEQIAAAADLHDIYRGTDPDSIAASSSPTVMTDDSPEAQNLRSIIGKHPELGAQKIEASAARAALTPAQRQLANTAIYMTRYHHTSDLPPTYTHDSNLVKVYTRLLQVADRVSGSTDLTRPYVPHRLSREGHLKADVLDVASLQADLAGGFPFSRRALFNGVSTVELIGRALEIEADRIRGQLALLKAGVYAPEYTASTLDA
jgi:hypothetical protein